MKVEDSETIYREVGNIETTALDCPEKVVVYIKDAFEKDPFKESFWLVSLNRKNKAIARHKISSGTLTSSLVHPREVFYPAINNCASAIIIVHNHPSGDPVPSSADIKVTRSIKEAGEILGIELIDHVIIGDPDEDPNSIGYYSFQEGGFL